MNKSDQKVTLKKKNAIPEVTLRKKSGSATSLLNGGDPPSNGGGSKKRYLLFLLLLILVVGVFAFWHTQSNDKKETISNKLTTDSTAKDDSATTNVTAENNINSNDISNAGQNKSTSDATENKGSSISASKSGNASLVTTSPTIKTSKNDKITASASKNSKSSALTRSSRTTGSYSKSSNEVIATSDVSCLFDFDKIDCNHFEAELERIAKSAISNGSKIVINAYADNVGDVNYNKGLSEKRALSVRDFLIQKGVSSKQIIAKGYGISEKFQNQAENRRADIIIK